jgi:pyrroline-5-carboxylate reductase
MTHSSVGFIGGGQMATALLCGALQSGNLSPNDVQIVETDPNQRDRLRERFQEVVIHSCAESLADCDRIVLAVKPQVLRKIASGLASQFAGNPLWISIAAGVSLQELSELLGSQRIIRVMPNTPAQVSAGAAALAAATGVESCDVDWTLGLMQSVGICVEVEEPQMHAVTGIAGSSPAYIYLIIEALSDAGVAGGLPRPVALQLAAQAVLGAAKMVLETGQHPGQLKDQVTSPAGTTIAALRELEAAGLRSAMLEGVAACIARSQELEQRDS